MMNASSSVIALLGVPGGRSRPRPLLPPRVEFAVDDLPVDVAVKTLEKSRFRTACARRRILANEVVSGLVLPLFALSMLKLMPAWPLAAVDRGRLL